MDGICAKRISGNFVLVFDCFVLYLAFVKKRHISRVDLMHSPSLFLSLSFSFSVVLAVLYFCLSFFITEMKKRYKL